MVTTIATDGVFSEPHKALLAQLADMMIPAAAEFPGAADPAIWPGVLERLNMSESMVKAGLDALQARAEQQHGQSFADLGAVQRQELIDVIRREQPVFMQTLQAHVVGAYYQDDRVLLGMGLPARSPHPGGYEVADTDWSLLDPVRAREPFYIDPAGSDSRG